MLREVVLPLVRLVYSIDSGRRRPPCTSYRRTPPRRRPRHGGRLYGRAGAGASAGNVTCTAAADETPCPTPAPTPCLASLIVVKARNFKNDDGVAKLWVQQRRRVERRQGRLGRRRRRVFCGGGAHPQQGKYEFYGAHDRRAGELRRPGPPRRERQDEDQRRGQAARGRRRVARAAGSWTGGPRWSKAKFPGGGKMRRRAKSSARTAPTRRTWIACEGEPVPF